MPYYSVAQTVREGGERSPTELLLNLVRSDRVAEIVSRTVFDEGDEVFVPVSRPGAQFVEQRADRSDDFKVGLLVVSAHVVALARTALVKDEVDRMAVVSDPEPVANVFARSVDGDRLVRETLADYRGNELFVVLPGPVVVRAVRDRHVHPVGARIGLD